jgi:hypothetical protein
MAVNRTETFPGPSVNCAVVAKNAHVSRLNYGIVTLMLLALNERRMSGHADEREFPERCLWPRANHTRSPPPFVVSCIRTPAQVQVRMTATGWA